MVPSTQMINVDPFHQQSLLCLMDQCTDIWGQEHRGGMIQFIVIHTVKGFGIVNKAEISCLPSQATTVEMTLTTKVLPGPALSPLGDGPEPPSPAPEPVPSRAQAAGKDWMADLPRWQERGPGVLERSRSEDN